MAQGDAGRGASRGPSPHVDGEREAARPALARLVDLGSWHDSRWCGAPCRSPSLHVGAFEVNVGSRVAERRCPQPTRWEAGLAAVPMPHRLVDCPGPSSGPGRCRRGPGRTSAIPLTGRRIRVRGSPARREFGQFGACPVHVHVAHCPQAAGSRARSRRASAAARGATRCAVPSRCTSAAVAGPNRFVPRIVPSRCCDAGNPLRPPLGALLAAAATIDAIDAIDATDATDATDAGSAAATTVVVVQPEEPANRPTDRRGALSRPSVHPPPASPSWAVAPGDSIE